MAAAGLTQGRLMLMQAWEATAPLQWAFSYWPRSQWCLQQRRGRARTFMQRQQGNAPCPGTTMPRRLPATGRRGGQPSSPFCPSHEAMHARATWMSVKKRRRSKNPQMRGCGVSRAPQTQRVFVC